MPKRVLILGAAGRDFHNFNVYFRDNEEYEVVAFTATQIPNIEGRLYPPELAGTRYPNGIPIKAESELTGLIKDLKVDLAVFSYSDVSHKFVMNLGCQVMAAGADYMLMGPKNTSLKSKVPVVSICASRTGAGKSQTSRRVAAILHEMGKRVVAIRHPMPYGNLVKQAVQRFATFKDLDDHDVTIEEREEYEPHLRNNRIVYAGIDYEAILRQAEKEADIIIWDGGNNDLPFYVPDLHIVVVDPHRPDHAERYYPGETNVRMADVIVINKIDTASSDDVETTRRIAIELNPNAKIVDAASPIFVEDGDQIKGKKVLVIEDGPTLTHGEMTFGAGWVAAKRYGAAEIIDPRPFAVGTIHDTFVKYPNTGPILPAMGYGSEQTKDLEQTINNSNADIVLVATPIDIRNVIRLEKPGLRVRYELQEIGEPTLTGILSDFVKSL
ncbi:GTPase [candidate division KSB1 bacterium]|nr:GTPase [candidate division KSB1 bacterium]